MKREDRGDAAEAVAETNDAPIDLTKKSHLESSEAPDRHGDLPDHKQPSPEWRVPPFYPPLFFLGGESPFRAFPAVAVANPFLLPYYPVLYQQLGLRCAVVGTDPSFDGVNCLYRAASDTYLKDRVLRNAVAAPYPRGPLAAAADGGFPWAPAETRGWPAGSRTNPLRKCRSLGALAEEAGEEAPCARSLSCPDLSVPDCRRRAPTEGPAGKRMKMEVRPSGNSPKEGNGTRFRRRDEFDLSAQSRSRSMPSVSQGDQESFLQKLRHVAPAGFPCNVYGYYTHLMQKYQDHEELKRRVGIVPENSPPGSPGPEAKKRPTRTLTGKHVRHGTGASPSTLLTLRQMIQERQRAKELAQSYGTTNKCKMTRKHSNKAGRRST
ncbi:uncharacterized protein LOC111637235 [Centruroides sculpturatus]|uniref:uncharacterized protein LOC111637235 n=1 Tax=Centruroides sculpturatus TaxID=218467 RepID=UPI000C6CA5BE|nr:uncharacterized protein LOC111637235 [Centruroides sculpturatus]